MPHTIVCIQTEGPSTRYYTDHDSINDAVDDLFRLFEDHLKKLDPEYVTRGMEYEINQVYDYLDSLADICFLVYDNSYSGYTPYSKAWIKEQIYLMLRKQVNNE